MISLFFPLIKYSLQFYNLFSNQQQTNNNARELKIYLEAVKALVTRLAWC